MPSTVPTKPAKSTARKPTSIDTRAPKISRDSTSRPMWSVPSRYSVVPPAIHAGGRKRRDSVPTSGLCGATNSAKTARKASTTRIAIGTIGTPSVRKAASRQATVSPAARLGAGALTLISDPRVDHGVEDIHHDVHDDDHGAAQHHRGLHHREVAERDPLVEQPADARPGKDSLDDHRHVDHQHEIDAGQGEHG